MLWDWRSCHLLLYTLIIGYNVSAIKDVAGRGIQQRDDCKVKVEWTGYCYDLDC